MELPAAVLKACYSAIRPTSSKMAMYPFACWFNTLSCPGTSDERVKEGSLSKRMVSMTERANDSIRLDVVELLDEIYVAIVAFAKETT